MEDYKQQLRNIGDSLIALAMALNFPTISDTGEYVIEPYVKQLYKIADAI